MSNLEFEERKRLMLGRNTGHYRAILDNMSEEQKEAFLQIEKEAREAELDKKKKTYSYRSPTYAK